MISAALLSLRCRAGLFGRHRAAGSYQISKCAFSVIHFERRTVLRPGLSVIVNARSGDISMAKPFLHFCDVSLIIERIRRGCRPQCVGADLKAQLRGISPHNSIHPIRCERLVEIAGEVVFHRPKQRPVLVRHVARRLEVLVDEGIGTRMQGKVARLLALA